MASHSSILSWKIPWAEKPGGLQSMGCKESDGTERLTLSSFYSMNWRFLQSIVKGRKVEKVLHVKEAKYL